MRTGNIYAPYPEEINRKLTASITALHFAPTYNAKQNLLNEGVSESKIFVTGNTVIDALLYAVHKIETNNEILMPYILQILEIINECFGFYKGNSLVMLFDLTSYICDYLKE